MTNPAGAWGALTDQSKLFFTDTNAAVSNLLGAEEAKNNPSRWLGSAVLSGGAGRVWRGMLVPKGKRVPGGWAPDRKFQYHYEASGHAGFPGTDGGSNHVSKVRGEDLEITPDLRERASYINPYRMDHILGRHGPDTPYMDINTTRYPETWNDAKIVEAIQGVINDPGSEWTRRDGDPGSLFATTGKYLPAEGVAPARLNVEGMYEGIRIRVSVEPYGEGVISGFKLMNQGG